MRVELRIPFSLINDLSSSQSNFNGSFTGGEGDIFFNGVDGSSPGNGFVISNTTNENQHMRLIQNPGRFIAEFIIISKE